MRTETQRFQYMTSTIYADPSNESFEICINIEKLNSSGCYCYLTKQQAAEFAHQILEMVDGNCV